MNSIEYQEIRLNDFPATRIYVLLKQDFRNKLIENARISLKLENYYALAQWINNKSLDYGLNNKFNGGDIGRWLIGSNLDSRTNINHPKLMPLWVVLELSETVKISSEKLHNSIILYRSGGSGGIIIKPMLPIKITPELESIIFHIFGDGSAGNFTPSFFQKNEIANKQFISKLKNCFGEFNVNTNDRFNIRFPKAITDILAHFYDIKSYHSDKIIIPSRIYETNKLSRLACITAFILDEGTIRDVISIASKNKLFLSNLIELMKSCGYECKEIKPHTPSDTFYLNMANGTIEKFYADYLELIGLFPNCSLANKHDRLVYLITRRKNKSTITNIDGEILNLLENDKLTTKEISEKLRFANCTILHHLEKLYKKGIINREAKDKGFVWFRNERCTTSDIPIFRKVYIKS